MDAISLKTANRCIKMHLVNGLFIDAKTLDRQSPSSKTIN